jgi:hypothetical protein
MAQERDNRDLLGRDCFEIRRVDYQSSLFLGGGVRYMREGNYMERNPKSLVTDLHFADPMARPNPLAHAWR